MRSKIALAVILLDDIVHIEAQVPHVKLALGAAGCANGTEIVSQALCQGAVATLGLNYTTNSWTDRTDVPRFCTHGDGFDTNMHWSNSSTGEGHEELAPVCRETPMRYIKLHSALIENWAAWREIEVYAQDHNGVSQNVALLGAATASSHCDHDQCGDSSHVPGMAIDGDVATSWNSGGAPPAWIEIDLGDVYYIDRVRAVFGPQPFCMAVMSEAQDNQGAGCVSYTESMCSNTSLVNANFNATRDCCVCGGGDRARVGVDGTASSPAHLLHMAGADHEYMEFEWWTSKPIDSLNSVLRINNGEVEYSAVLSGRPHGLFTCSPLENDIDYVVPTPDNRGGADNHHHGGRVESAEGCCALCQSEYAAGCRFWSWDGDDRCYLKTSNAGRTSSVGRISGAVAQVASTAPHTEAQCEGAVHVGMDIEGFDIHGHVRAVTADECCAACSDEYANGCRYWTFHDDHCHLKSSNVTMRAREGRVSGSLGAAILEQAELMTCAVVEEGIEYHGSGMDLPGGDIDVASAEECCDQCQGAYGLGCRFWTYKINDGKCQRKTGQGERRDHSERISGSVGGVVQQETEAQCGEMEEGVEFHGPGSEMEGGHMDADSAAHCCELCRDSFDDGCRFWSYKTDNGHCHRRINIGDGRRQREGTISGAVMGVDIDSSNDLAGFTNAQIDGASSAAISMFTVVTLFALV